MRRRAVILALVELTLAVGAAAGRPARDDTGSQTAVPQRIVSLVPALTEMLFAVGAGPQVVGVSSYDTFPDEVRSLPKVGALLDSNVERILSLTPDLVATYGSQVDLKRQLQQASIRVYDYRHAGLPDILTTLRDLGRVTGHAAQADRVAAEIEQRLAAVRTRVGATRPVRTLLVFGRERGALRNVYASGGVGFMHDMLTLAGGTNVFADVARESVQASTETMLARAPDVILEVREGPERSDAEQRAMVAEWMRLSTVPAVRAGRIHIVSGTGLVVPGPRVASAVERFAVTLHPPGAR